METPRILKNGIALTGLIIIFLYIIIIIVSAIWLPFDPAEMDVKHVLEPPSITTGHIFV